MSGKVQVQVWSDIACPWCYVGKRRFERAILDMKDPPEVHVTWRAFELDPGAPAEYDPSLSYVERLAGKYSVSDGQAQNMISQMVDTGASVGIDFEFARMRAGNTFDAHQFLRLAEHRGLQGAAKERLFRAYFTEGVLVSNLDALRRFGGELGLDEEEVHDAIVSQAYAKEVRHDEQAARELGVTGVPFFAIGRYGVSGAQPPDRFMRILEKVRDEADPSVA